MISTSGRGDLAQTARSLSLRSIQFLAARLSSPRPCLHPSIMTLVVQLTANSGEKLDLDIHILQLPPSFLTRPLRSIPPRNSGSLRACEQLIMRLRTSQQTTLWH